MKHTHNTDSCNPRPPKPDMALPSDQQEDLWKKYG